MLYSKPKAFTIIELLVVIAIIGILVILIIAALSTARARARDGRRKQDLKSLKTGLAIYFDNEDRYPLPTQYTSHDGKDGLDTYAELMSIKPALPHDPQCKDETGPDCSHLDYGYSVGKDAGGSTYTDAYVLGANLEGEVAPPGKGITKCDTNSDYNYCVGDYVEEIVKNPMP